LKIEYDGAWDPEQYPANMGGDTLAPWGQRERVA